MDDFTDSETEMAVKVIMSGIAAGVDGEFYQNFSSSLDQRRIETA